MMDMLNEVFFKYFTSIWSMNDYFFLYFLHSCSKWSWFGYMYVYQKLISHFLLEEGPSWSYGSWIYNYLFNHCLSPLTLQVRIPLRRGVLDTTLCDKVCQWLRTSRWFSLSTLVSSANQTEHKEIMVFLELQQKFEATNINYCTFKMLIDIPNNARRSSMS